MKTILTKQQTCNIYGCTIDQLNKQYLNNAKRLERMYDKAVELDKKINGYTAEQLKQMAENYHKLSQ